MFKIKQGQSFSLVLTVVDENGDSKVLTGGSV